MSKTRDHADAGASVVELFVEQIAAIGDEMAACAHVRVARVVGDVADGVEIDRRAFRRFLERGEEFFLLRHAFELPHAERAERGDARDRQQPREQGSANARRGASSAQQRYTGNAQGSEFLRMWQTLVIVGIFIVIVSTSVAACIS